MKIAEPDLATRGKWVISTQLIVSTIVAVVFLTKGTWESLAAVYGGLVSVCISILLLWGFHRANIVAKEDPGKSMRILYIGAVQRFVLVLGLIAVGIGVLKLDPVALCVGFALAQLGYLIGSHYKNRTSERT